MYNNKLSKNRSAVERAFGLLKGRVRRLKYVDMMRTDLIPMFCIACCVLHNICGSDDDDSDNDYAIDNSDSSESDDESHCHVGNQAAIRKRNRIMSQFSS